VRTLGWGYCDDGDAGLLHVGARYYDPQVGRFTSRDAVLGEHPYLYCEHEPVNSVDPSGNLPTWEDVKRWGRGAGDWIKEHGQTILKGVGTVIGVVTGIKIAEEVYIVYVDWDCSNRMRDMLRDWGHAEKHPELQELINYHIRDAMRDTGRLVGDAARQIYRVRPVPPQ